MDAIQVNAVLLRAMLPDLPLTAGTKVMGRVLERHAQHGLLNIGGAILVAKLPDGVEPGQRLRLAVSEVTGDTIVMRVVPDAAAQQQQLPVAIAGPSVAIPVPGGAAARLQVVGEEAGAGEAPGTQVVTVRYDSPQLGRIEVRLALGPDGLVAGVGASPGQPVELAGEHAGELRGALARAVGRPVDVHVATRRDRVDLRA
jgi:hypothetical protein